MANEFEFVVVFSRIWQQNKAMVGPIWTRTFSLGLHG